LISSFALHPKWSTMTGAYENYGSDQIPVQVQQVD